MEEAPKPNADMPDMPAPLQDLYKAGDDMIDIMFSLALCVLIVGFHVAFFGCVRDRYPKIYGNNIETGEVPELEEGYFSWIYESLAMTLESIVEIGGLDVAMFLKNETYKHCFSYIRILPTSR